MEHRDPSAFLVIINAILFQNNFNLLSLHNCIMIMNSNYHTVINNLKRKIEQIISGYEQLAAENRLIKEELNKCSEELKEYKQLNLELEEKINKLQLAEAFKSSSSDAKEAKQKIAIIIKEIDKCISLLND